MWQRDAYQVRISYPASLSRRRGLACLFLRNPRVLRPAARTAYFAYRKSQAYIATAPPEAFLKASLFYRTAAVVLLLCAIGHTLGFRQADPKWGADSLLASMRSLHFDVQGFNRSYWDFYVGSGFSVGVFFLFSAILAWQLGGLPVETLARMRGTAWAFALCFAAITLLCWRYFFLIPVVFSLLTTVCLTAGAWRSGK